MCGRYKVSTKAPEILKAFDIDLDHAYEPKARFNVAPTDPVPCVRIRDGHRQLVEMKWGLLPFWAKSKSEGARMINARVETILDKRAFKDAFEKRRCLVVSDGFYEWLGKGKKDKQPYLMRFDDGHVFAYAGLWSRWHDPNDANTVLETVSIITTTPNSVAGKIHDRMPLIFDPANDREKIDAWLDVDRSIDLAALSEPRELAGFTSFPVDKRVGNVKNDDPALAEPVAAQPTLV
jgi:putative SOS response-associated peptidase YedK